MPRYKLTIEYDGAAYVGWQIQENGPSIQGALAAAIKKFCGASIIPAGAGRTDAGVHALGQVAHIDLERDWAAETVRNAINQHLKPALIAVVHCERTTTDFDARFSAIERRYLFRIVNRKARLTLDLGRAWHVATPLDEDAMEAGAAHLLGLHDFTTFRSVHCQARSPIKTLDQLEVRRAGDVLEITAAARSFMHNQVRSMAGSLKLVGEGKWRPEQMGAALAARSRAACGPVAPACGLYLTEVMYDEV